MSYRLVGANSRMAAPLPEAVCCGSWILALVSLVAAGVAVSYTQGALLERLCLRWQVLVMIVWLSVASQLIQWAHKAARRFQRQTSAFIKTPLTSPELLSHESNVRSKTLLIVALIFIMAGVPAIVLIDASVCWKVCWGITIASTFYYGAFGIWGAWIVTRAVHSLAKEATDTGSLNLFHADRLAGLAFALKYADVATMLMLTGAAAVPLGLFLSEQCMNLKTPLGNFMAVTVVLLIFTWAVMAVTASVRGRAAIASAVDDFRALLFDRIAERKQKLIKDRGEEWNWKMLEAEEEAAARLKVGLLFGAGAWKDMLSLTVAVGAICKFANSAIGI